MVNRDSQLFLLYSIIYPNSVKTGICKMRQEVTYEFRTSACPYGIQSS